MAVALSKPTTPALPVSDFRQTIIDATTSAFNLETLLDVIVTMSQQLMLNGHDYHPRAIENRAEQISRIAMAAESERSRIDDLIGRLDGLVEGQAEMLEVA